MQVRVQQLGPGMMQQIQSVCHECQGQGERIDPKHRCKTCNGRKVNNLNHPQRSLFYSDKYLHKFYIKNLVFCQHFGLFQLYILAMLSRQTVKSLLMAGQSRNWHLNKSHASKCKLHIEENVNVGNSDTFPWSQQCHCKRGGLYRNLWCILLVLFSLAD